MLTPDRSHSFWLAISPSNGLLSAAHRLRERHSGLALPVHPPTGCYTQIGLLKQHRARGVNAQLLINSVAHHEEAQMALVTVNRKPRVIFCP